MSSDEDHNVCVPAKRRRVQRACDACRIKKSDEVQNSGKKCSNCVENELDCTFGGAVAKRKSYVDVLEARLELTEQLLRKERVIIISNNDTSATSSVDPGIDLAALTIRSINAPPPAPQKDDLTHIDLAQELRGLSMNTHWDRFHGKASMALLARAAVHQRDACAHQAIQLKPRRMHYWTFDPTKDRRRHVGPYVFPEADLMFALVDNYFIHTNLYFPLLHRPTFERCIADKMHLRDESFGAVLLLVCAIGSRFSNDPRVCDPHDEPLRCGWKYFDQLPLAIDHLFVRPTLYHLQYYCGSPSYGFSTPNACWTLVGLGIRIAQEVGAHRANAASAAPTAESELWKRAFWVIVCYDRICSSMLGRPCTTQYEDFDVELPIECDDEFWETEDPAQAFKQPEGKPSQIAFFNCFVRLNNILAFSLKMLYSLNKTNNLLAARDEAWEEHIVAELDSALNAWVDAIPDHLRWDPDREEDNFFDQSALLYCTYYQVQMTIHRPFIPMVRKDASTALPSLAICTNAARSCSHVSDISTQRKNGTPVPVLLGATFTSALVLLLSIFSGKRIRLPPQLNSAMVEVHKCMASMRPCETRCARRRSLFRLAVLIRFRWQSAGLYWYALLWSAPRVPISSLGHDIRALWHPRTQSRRCACEDGARR
ncbi:fungal-specific transcription factor domain-containing protein [Mycena rosella]|uniref:Fungal-specific transcription factor domain-containing protein n=1 Tax=Mycena rosella TaxID=1033263 RepID=A0AAD7C9U3_MYCRO|nr:fungal-specific transcription factor domain-containing protein [Mycena rosella]